LVAIHIHLEHGMTPTPDPTIGEQLREVARLYSRAQRTVADCCGTTSTQCQLLVELGRHGALAMGELGQRLCLEKSWISRAVDGLVDNGWALRQPNPADARSSLVTLTAAGLARVGELNATLDTHAARLMDGLGSRDRATVARALHLVLQALRNGPDIAACCPPAAAAAATSASTSPTDCRSPSCR
jgi:DNA-binding MarR family transcriptional regulator